MYIDHISGSLQNFNNSMRGLQGLAELDEQRRKRQLQASIEAKDRGDNPTAERLFLESQRGLLGNLLGSDSKEWTVTNPFKKQKQEQYNVNADQGGLLASLIDSNSSGYNPDMANLMAQGKPLENLSDLHNMQSKGILSLTDKAVQQQFQPQLQAYADNKRANDKIKAFNQKYEHMEGDIGGNEELQQQKILQYAHDSIRMADTPQEQIKAYMDYRTKVKAINDHYGHQMQAESPAFFGIGLGGKAGTEEKTDAYLYGDTEQVVHIPAWAMKRSKDRESYISKYYPDIYKEGTILKRAGTNSGETLNPLQKADLTMKETMIKEAEFTKADEIKKQTASIFSGNKTDIDNANKALAAQGSNVRFDYDGNKYQINQNTDKVAKTKPQNEVDQFLGD